MIVLNYFVYYCLIIPISLLPFRVLYFLSDLLYLVLYKLAGYRKKVVMQNIRNSCPSMSKSEHLTIAQDFYHHMCDLIMESIKIFTISEKEVVKRMVCSNPELVNRFYKEGTSIIMTGGHYNNWELFAVAIHKFILHHPVGIYKPLNSKFFNVKMQKTRGKFGLGLLPIKEVKSFFEKEKNNLNAIIFGIDQSPSSAAHSYWLKFLNQDTAVSFGAERYAVKYNYPVVFTRLIKIRRGYYRMEFEEITVKPTQEPHGFIMDQSSRLLEQDILRAPAFWLWSHRRWKKRRNTDRVLSQAPGTYPE